MADLWLLGKNLESLRPYQPHLVSQLETSKAAGDLVVQRARDGSISVAVEENTHGTVQLHSRYRPAAEAARTVKSLGPASTLVVLGMGGMFVPREYLQTYPQASVLVLERDVSTVRALLETLNLSDLFRTGRLRIAADGETLFSQLTGVHQPVIQDGLTVYELRSWTERTGNSQVFKEYHRQLQETLRHIAGEYNTMVRYGRAWFVHTLKNTLQINWAGVAPSVVEVQGHIRSAPIRIIAAGPSLDENIHRLSDTDGRSHREHFHSIVVDTALPAMVGRNLPGFGAVTLDPQGWSPLHFRTLKQKVPYLWGDLGVSPQLQKWTHRFIPLGSNHPLHQLLARYGFPLFHIPGSRNVSETAVRVVQALGGTIGEVVGDDFSYPAGKTYARNTYHYTIARGISTRLYPEETFFADQVYPDGIVDTADPESCRTHPRFRKPGMAAAESEFLTILKGGNASDRFIYHRESQGDSTPGDSVPDIHTFWTSHAEELGRFLRHALPGMGQSTPDVLEALGPHGRAHLPLLAALRTSHRSLEENLEVIFEKVRGFIFSDLGRYSKRDEG